jgi:CBS domain-containing protein
MHVADVMSRDVIQVKLTENALAVGTLMEERKVGAVVVVEGGQFKGILSKETFIANIDNICERPLESLTVEDLMESDIDTVREDEDMMKAADILLTQKSIIDRLPVVSDGKVTGMISKADFTRLFYNSMKGKFKVSTLMHYDPPCVFDYTPLTEVVAEMKSNPVKRILVLSGENLVGIITIRDLSLVLFRQRKFCKPIDPTSTICAEDIMTRKPITAHKKDDAADAAKIMVERNIGGIPVLDGRLEGIITRTDIMKGYQIAHTQSNR